MTDTDLIAADNVAASPESPAKESKSSSGGSLATMVLPELRALASQAGVKGTSGMRKGELIAAITEVRSGGSHHGGRQQAEPAEQRQSQDVRGDRSEAPADEQTKPARDNEANQDTPKRDDTKRDDEARPDRSREAAGNRSAQGGDAGAVDTVDEAVAIANASKFGLVSYVWTEDLSTAMRCARDIRAGTVWVNTAMIRDLRAPFGGYKESGIGRDGPQASLEFFTELKATIIPIDPVKGHRYGAA